jgi:hypothetical protein
MASSIWCLQRPKGDVLGRLELGLKGVFFKHKSIIHWPMNLVCSIISLYFFLFRRLLDSVGI